MTHTAQMMESCLETDVTAWLQLAGLLAWCVVYVPREPRQIGELVDELAVALEVHHIPAGAPCVSGRPVFATAHSLPHTLMLLDAWHCTKRRAGMAYTWSKRISVMKRRMSASVSTSPAMNFCLLRIASQRSSEANSSLLSHHMPVITDGLQGSLALVGPSKDHVSK